MLNLGLFNINNIEMFHIDDDLWFDIFSVFLDCVFTVLHFLHFFNIAAFLR